MRLPGISVGYLLPIKTEYLGTCKTEITRSTITFGERVGILNVFKTVLVKTKLRK